MSQENTSMSAPSRFGSRSPECAGLIEWYDSPNVSFASHEKLQSSGLLIKSRSAEDFSPSRSLISDTPSTSDFESFWSSSPAREHVTPSGGNSGANNVLFNDVSHSKPILATPRRNHRFSRVRRRTNTTRQHSLDENKTPSLDENKTASSEKCLSMEEGLAFGKASLMKLRQRLHSEGGASVLETLEHDNMPSHPFRAVLQCSPNISPISSTTESKRNMDVVLTPSLARLKPSHKASSSTPKSTSLKRYQTMDESPVCGEGVKKKVARTKSMCTSDDASDDDSFVDDVFVPFTHPSQYMEMLKQGFVKW